MGSAQSSQLDEEEDEEEEEEEDDNGGTEQRESENPLMKKLLQQEPEMLPCHASASPLSPQLSTVGTPRLGPSIKVWDPYNVLAPPPPPPPPPAFSRSYSSDGLDDDRTVTEVFLINHGECGVNLRPDLVSGRWPEAALTPNGKRQGRALSVFLNSQGVRFNAVYSSPLDRARTTAISICRELSFTEEQIQYLDELLEMGQGQWEGCLQSEIFTPEMVNIIDRFQPDFCAPSGESLRHVEFRMIQFLNVTVLKLPERLREMSLRHQNESKGFSHQNSHFLPNSFHDRDGPVLPPSHSDLLYRQRQGLQRKKSGKSRLQFVTKIGDHETEDEVSPHESSNQDPLHDGNIRSSSFSIGVFTHAVPIKCLLTGLLGCSPTILHKICIDDSSVTVLQHSFKTGWQIKRMNDTAHLRLL
ncbi:Histidine phosphatase superfamily [Macleaya cordata]|uniref:Histidine phosphatase superfamily n=1 Tax=Macleaya cordata TaxID=56857 RepID=A0A200R3T9_MACCD|nr:Histidine phosphatase superfamily [Macleaya cordata]